MASPRILLLGGHGKVSLLMTPKLLSRSWNVTSVIRNPDQKAEILEVGKNGPGKIDVLVESIEDVKSDAQATAILEKTKAEWVIWSAGAGGKGGPSRTNAIDRDACIHFIRASVSSPVITKFLLVSAISSRRDRAPWWDDESWAMAKQFNEEIAPTYYKAKLASDEVLTVLGEQKKGFGYIILRPGALTDDKETGKFSFGKTRARGQVTRGDVAEVAVRLLEKEGVRGWFDLLGGEEETGVAVDRVLKEGFNSVEGEDIEVMKKDVASL
ncbi:NAD(P)-binding protein [Hyaloscypha variabilis F]|uniref:NAD(P)-binding protein n=1 Tax=Hyaloscypha variabilis (strain UAMH 11265 / GT02V1 / F) TaxID=1149755 RepID=A0A2J6REF2_HYAVF|nr:NAD(P)-binding protein [Hyaloscypha variabilis F]